MKPLRTLLLLVSLALFSTSAFADGGAQTFVEREHGKLTTLLRKAPSAGRDAEITGELDVMVDYALLARRTFGDPCPTSNSACQNHWGDLSEAQRSEVTDLLKKLVQKNYKKNLIKTLDYEVTFKNSTETNGLTRVRSRAESKVNKREAPTSIDYVVVADGSSFRIVDIITEGSSLTKNYYTQFHKMLATPDQGFPHIVKKLREKLAK